MSAALANKIAIVRALENAARNSAH